MPEQLEDHPGLGVGIRFNGDDDDNDGVPDFRDNNGVAGENDLIRIDLDFGAPKPPPGVTYYLRRDSAAIEVWQGVTKQQRVNFGNNEAVIRWEANQENNEVHIRLQANQGNAGVQTYFVEWVSNQAQPLTATLTFEARMGNQVISSDTVRFYRFQTIVIVIGGFTQNYTMDREEAVKESTGIYIVARELYDSGYDVHAYRENDQDSGYNLLGRFNPADVGRGSAYSNVVRFLQHHNTNQIVIIGYSYGGGATHNLAWRLRQRQQGALAQNREPPLAQQFTIPFTAYVDAIVHGTRNAQSETRLPPNSQYHVNLYQRIDRTVVQALGITEGIRGASVQGAQVDHDVNDPRHGYGQNITHTMIDDNLAVLQRIVTEFFGRNIAP
ncbi:MAG: hypothetical protein RMJ19_13405 [Gemmatales bacterium]|nr:hypothetical protein [Gemmatales bacterium]MDW8176667.1 hypothetical protein [Gemmatales bacterium]